MPAVTLRRAALAAGLAAVALPAWAVGLGPLSKSGLTDQPEKGFYLTLLNPYAEYLRFTAEAIAIDSEAPQPRVAIFPSSIMLGGGRNTQLLVIAHDLQPGETYQFRVCAQRAQPPAGVFINARVCSKLTARRVRLPGADGDAGAG